MRRWAELNRILEGQPTDVDIESLTVDEKTAMRSKCQIRRAVIQAESNRLALSIANDKHGMKMQLIQSPEERDRAELAKVAADAAKKEADDKKAAKKEAAEQIKADKAASAKAKQEEKQRKAAEKASGRGSGAAPKRTGTLITATRRWALGGGWFVN